MGASFNQKQKYYIFFSIFIENVYIFICGSMLARLSVASMA
jgi:hypothetical protein